MQTVWRARLEEQLGTFVLEPLDLKAGAIMEEPFRLAGLATLSALSQLLPEREPHPRVYEALRIVLDAIDNDAVWPALLVRWELGLLDELGFGLDLSKCAATGARDRLVYVSPKSGKAVSEAAGEPFRDRLFGLPAFLREGGVAAPPGDIIEGLRLAAFFLDRHLFEPRGVTFPEQQDWIIRTLAETPH